MISSSYLPLPRAHMGRGGRQVHGIKHTAHEVWDGVFFFRQDAEQVDPGPVPRRVVPLRPGTRPEPINSTPMGVNSISSGSPHVRPKWALSTCGKPGEIKKNTNPKNITAPLCEQAPASSGEAVMSMWYRLTFDAGPSPRTLLHFGYAPWAIHLHNNGGQFDFARPNARTPLRGVRLDELAKSTCASWGVRVGELVKSRKMPPPE